MASAVAGRLQLLRTALITPTPLITVTATTTTTAATATAATCRSSVVGVMTATAAMAAANVRSFGANHSSIPARHRAGSYISTPVIKKEKKRDPDLPTAIEDPIAFSVSKRRLAKGQIGRRLPAVPKTMELFDPLPAATPRQQQAALLIANKPYSKTEEARALYEPEFNDLCQRDMPIREKSRALAELYDEMRTLKVAPSLPLCNNILATISTDDTAIRFAERLMLDIKTFNFPPTSDTYRSLFRLFGRLPDGKVTRRTRVMEVWGTATERKLLESTPSFWVDLVDAVGVCYAKLVDMQLIRAQMKELKVPAHPNLDCSLVEAYVRNARYHDGRTTVFESVQDKKDRKQLILHAIEVLETAMAEGRTPMMKTWRALVGQWSLIAAEMSSQTEALPKFQIPTIPRTKDRAVAEQPLSRELQQECVKFIQQVKAFVSSQL